MRLDPKLREELAIKRYEQADRTGVCWKRRPEWLKQAFREAVERDHQEDTRASFFDPIAAGLATAPSR